MKIENVMAANANVDVVWIAGSACTGCTMSLLNSVFYTTIDDLLLNRIDLKYMDTAMATAGAYVDGVQWQGSNALKAAQDVYNNSAGFVLVVEGAIPTGTPDGSTTAGDYCRIGDLTGDGSETDTVLGNVAKFAAKDTCLAVLCVGTCASFGGIPAARGNVVSAKGVCYTGTAQGGAIVSNSGTGSVTRITVDSGGSGYTAVPLVTIAPPVSGVQATATARTTGTVTAIAVVNQGSGYTAVPDVTILGVCKTVATATAVMDVFPNTDRVASISVIGGSGYSTVSGEVTVVIDSVNGQGKGATATPTVTGNEVASLILTNPGSGYTSAPAVTFGVPGAGAAAHTIIQGQNDVRNKTGIAAKVINIPGCPPHPDWIVGTIAHILDTNVTLPPVTNYFRPVDYGYGAYQCNAGPCPWRYNNSTTRDDHNARYPVGNSKELGKYKWGLKPGTDVYAEGCLGILGCKGRKTKADCSRRRWNADAEAAYGVNWCVGSRAGCHGCTEPSFPDKVGKFFTFV